MNHRNPAIKRILADVKELQKHPSSRYYAEPLEDNLFEWHFTIRGPEDTPFAGGMYHGRILLPAEYPFKPPNIVFLTKNGRFEVGTKICLSISAYHEESWQPAWGVRTMLEAIISFFPSEGAGAIGALDWSPEERKRLAILSRSYVCPLCGPIHSLLSEPSSDEKEKPDSVIQEQVAQLHFGPPPQSDSSKHAFTTVASDFLISNAINSPVAEGEGITNTSIDENCFMEPENITDLHDSATAEIVVEQSTIELSEDALDNFETMQDIEELGYQNPSALQSIGKPSADDGEQVQGHRKSTREHSSSEHQNTHANEHANNIHQHVRNVHPHVPPLRDPPALDEVDRFRRIEDFLNTIILVTIIGILAILIRVFIRNYLKIDL